MTKKVYIQPELQVTQIHTIQMLAISVQTTGLGDENLTKDETTGNAWDDAMSRRKNDWDDEEEEEW